MEASASTYWAGANAPRYLKALGESPLKTELNEYSKSVQIDLEEVTDDYVSNSIMKTELYRQAVYNEFSRGHKKMVQNGVIPTKYMAMGTSPRIMPVSVGQSINAVKPILRYEYYQKLADAHEGFSILDLDLKSCHTSILLGVSHEFNSLKLGEIRRALSTIGLWEYIRHHDFILQGMEDNYNKAAVKLCVYSSFFSNGSRDMIEGIMEQYRRTLGISVPEFKSREFEADYERLLRSASDIASVMENSRIMGDFRRAANTIYQIHLNDSLIRQQVTHI